MNTKESDPVKSWKASLNVSPQTKSMWLALVSIHSLYAGSAQGQQLQRTQNIMVDLAKYDPKNPLVAYAKSAILGADILNWGGPSFDKDHDKTHDKTHDKD